MLMDGDARAAGLLARFVCRAVFFALEFANGRADARRGCLGQPRGLEAQVRNPTPNDLLDKRGHAGSPRQQFRLPITQSREVFEPGGSRSSRVISANPLFHGQWREGVQAPMRNAGLQAGSDLRSGGLPGCRPYTALQPTRFQ